MIDMLASALADVALDGAAGKGLARDWRKCRDWEMARPASIDVVRRAYELWEQSGKPEGRDQEFYLQAERDLQETAALRGGSQSSARPEPTQHASVDPELPRQNSSARSAPDVAGGNEPTMTDQPASPLAGLSLDRAIHLRWVLRDIKSERTEFSPVSPDDLRTLIEMGLIEMQDDEPVLTNKAHRAIGSS
jgi:Protein of unknown function (DUF2934)